MKIRLSTKLFIAGIAVVMISLIGVSIYRIQTNHKLYQQSPKININSSTVTIEVNENSENEISE